MSTTVSYKGNTIATINHGNSATLTTQGTWVEDNITVNASALNLQSKTVNPTTSLQIITADNGYDGLENVTINAVKYYTATISGSGGFSSYAIYDSVQYSTNGDTFAFNSGETLQLHCGGGHTADSAIYINNVEVASGTSSVNYTYTLPDADISITFYLGSYGTIKVITSDNITLQSKTVTPTESQQIITADNGYSGLSSVTIAAIPANYVNSSSLATYYTGSSEPSSGLGANGDIYLQTD